MRCPGHRSAAHRTAGPAQAQGVAHHDDAGGGHGSPGDHRVEQPGGRQREYAVLATNLDWIR